MSAEGSMFERKLGTSILLFGSERDGEVRRRADLTRQCMCLRSSSRTAA
jgi:hypothetical protein